MQRLDRRKKYETKMVIRFDIHIYIYIYIYTATVDKFNSFDLTLISFHLRAWTREDATKERKREIKRE